ncbi:hypothetical protein [Corallococcus terminator]|uniref:Uncharacterized protein n=1 Tax=Corallococcus terminator TaxID=2316733 RepID=A0A3A8IJ89_9BACT|nr:hypothetical protein [Corallococcus terminator]RKG77513.1 hypothetical protein D7V88_30940 [Corallococcus terminator]
MASLIITDPAASPQQQQQEARDDAPPGAEPTNPTTTSIPVNAPPVFKSLLQSVSDLAEMQKNTFEILQKQMLETQSQVLRSLLSTVDRRLKTVMTAQVKSTEESPKLTKVGIK